MNLVPLLTGMGVGAGLIIAIGAQNAHVLRHGILRRHVFTVCALCVAIDWSLITLGAAGFGSVIARFPSVTRIAAWGGALFLVAYGLMALRNAFHPQTLHAERSNGIAEAGWGKTVTITLAVSLLNPHVYLDTIVLLGSIAAQYPDAQRWLFAAGAGLASLMWFFMLGYGARLLAPVFEDARAWRVLDVVIGAIMLSIALGLVRSEL